MLAVDKSFIERIWWWWWCQGVQVHVPEQCKSPCMYVHRHAHRLNFVLVSACSNNPRVLNALGLMEGIFFLHTRVSSTSRLVHSMSTWWMKAIPFCHYPRQSDTRWVCKHKLSMCLSRDLPAYEMCCLILRVSVWNELNELKLMGFSISCRLLSLFSYCTFSIQ